MNRCGRCPLEFLFFDQLWSKRYLVVDVEAIVFRGGALGRLPIRVRATSRGSRAHQSGGAWTLQENGTCGFPKNLKVRNRMVTATTTFKACNHIVGGPALTLDGTVDFEAGISVGFGDGTTFDGTVSVKIDPSLISP